jgi:uncharacterized protein (TIGR02757 family)
MTTEQLLRLYAEKYESSAFQENDPSKFMHLVKGARNQEATAFVASCLSYGSRQQFIPKIQTILDWADGEVDEWTRRGLFSSRFAAGDTRCFYRLYSHGTMHRFLSAYQHLLLTYGSLGDYVRHHATDGYTAIAAICQYFGGQGVITVVPKDTRSACKRVCLFLRWMVRSNSPVDLGLWADFIDRRTLIIPLDTHVLRQSTRLGLLKSKTATMSTARRLTAALSDIFRDDPLKGDYALFGYGTNHR